jgi:YgiT-type zinc finger domain-containing protein
MDETLVATTVTYTLEHEGALLMIEHVPARVCQETGEQLFAPETVERLHALLRHRPQPTRVITTPVYEFA